MFHDFIHAGACQENDNVKEIEQKRWNTLRELYIRMLKGRWQSRRVQPRFPDPNLVIVATHKIDPIDGRDIGGLVFLLPKGHGLTRAATQVLVDLYWKER